jgi:transposase
MKETTSMMVIGIDPHKRTHTAVAVDEVGRKKGERTVQARDHGHVQLLVWARKLAPEERIWAVEDVRHVAGGLVRDLLAAGETVVPVPPNRTAGERRGGRERGKSDPIDALAIARLALREPDLPTARLDEQTRPIRLLVDHREALVAERTRLINRVLWLVHDLNPALAAAVTKLKQVTTRRKLTARLQALPATAARRVALAQIALIDSLSVEIDAIEKELKPLVQARVPRLMAIVGVNVVTAAKLLGEVGDITRFRSSAAFARHNGTAPIPVWSGNDDRHRLNRGGNRQLNTTLHRIAITQARCHEGARALLKRRQETTRDTTKGSFRVLKRHLSDVIYRALIADHHAHNDVTSTSPK